MTNHQRQLLQDLLNYTAQVLGSRKLREDITKEEKERGNTEAAALSGHQGGQRRRPAGGRTRVPSSSPCVTVVRAQVERPQ
jgi:hypothetical protein